MDFTDLCSRISEKGTTLALSISRMLLDMGIHRSLDQSPLGVDTEAPDVRTFTRVIRNTSLIPLNPISPLAILFCPPGPNPGQEWQDQRPTTFTIKG